MKSSVLLVLYFLFGMLSLKAQDSIASAISVDSLVQTIDTTELGKLDKPSNLLDSLKQPLLARKFFFLNEKISGTAVLTNHSDFTRDLPQLKAIRLRKIDHEPWKFWILLITILMLALTRLLNIKRFDEILISAFDLQADYIKYSDKTGNYFLSNLVLFINFTLSFSLFLTTLLQLNHQIETDSYYLLFWMCSLLITLVYVAKILLNLIIGFIFKIQALSMVILFNAIMINNFLGVALVFLNLFFVFVSNAEVANLFSAIILITILVSVVYRQIKNLIMTAQSSRVQILYIILYLCALEILPWLILFKMFLNSW